MGFNQGLCELCFFSSVPPQLVAYALPGTAPGEPIKKVCCVGDSCTSGSPLPSKSLHSFTSLMRKYCRSIGQGRRINEEGSEPGYFVKGSLYVEAEGFMAAYSTRCVSGSARKDTKNDAESTTVLPFWLLKTAVHNNDVYI